MKEIENEIYQLWEKMKPFMLFISKKEYGDNKEGGRLMFYKAICVQDKYLEAFDYLKSCYEERKDPSVPNRPNKDQLTEFREKLKSLNYFIERPVENFDDFPKTTIIIGIDNKQHKISELATLVIFDFNYLNEFVMDFDAK